MHLPLFSIVSSVQRAYNGKISGYGADYLMLNTHFRQEFNKWWFLGSIFYLTTITLYKTSIILLLQRIFVQRGFQIACWCTLLVNTCWGLGNILGYARRANFVQGAC